MLKKTKPCLCRDSVKLEVVRSGFFLSLSDRLIILMMGFALLRPVVFFVSKMSLLPIKEKGTYLPHKTCTQVSSQLSLPHHGR